MHQKRIILLILTGGILISSSSFVLSQLATPPTSPASTSPNRSSNTAPSLAQTDYASELLRSTNTARQKAGLSPLKPSSALNRAAQQQAEDIAAHQGVDHQGSDGSNPIDRARKAGYPSDYVGENLAAGRLTPQATIDGWLSNPRYRTNLLNPRFTDVGFGYVYAPTSPYQHYWVQVFGGLASPTSLRTSACSGTQILTANDCEGDEISAEEAKLVRLINQYRAQYQLSPISSSLSLHRVANRHSRDLEDNLTAYNQSGQDWRFGWSNCAYDAQKPTTFNCMWSAPQRLRTTYQGQAYELICGGNGDITAEQAIQCWQSSALNKDLLLNQSFWQNMTWQAIGVSLDRNYAILWIGAVPDNNQNSRSHPTIPANRPGRIW